MRAIAAVILAAFSLRSHAHTPGASRDVTPPTPVQRLYKCARTLGPTKCLTALSYYRAQSALTAINDKNLDVSLAKDVENFPWEKYANNTDEDLYSKLCSGTEKLLQYKTLNFNMIPNYEIQLASRGNGTLNIDVFNKPEIDTSRGMKKMRKMFYNIVPYLLLPGLVMSAILPFVLPALKMMTMAAGMINNMALSGAVFTLLRNNAFNDKYDHKVIYVNEGYHNEKHAIAGHDYGPELDYNYEASEVHEKPEHVQIPGTREYVTVKGVSQHIRGSDFDIVEELPSNDNNMDWINQYYASKFVSAKKDKWREGERKLRV